MILRAFSRAIALAAAVFVAACANNAEIPLDRRATAATKHIGLITLQFPPHPSIVLASTVGQSFGLVGALVDETMAAGREEVFETLAKEQAFDAKLEFETHLVAALAARGYTVTPVAVKRWKTADFFADYSSDGHEPVDAYLDVVVLNWGYTAAGIGSSTPYRPRAIAIVRLVSAKDSSILMKDTVIYNPFQSNLPAVTIAPDPAFTFTDWDTFKAQAPLAIRGSAVSLDQTADSIAGLL
jgi:hypothetical protein